MIVIPAGDKTALVGRYVGEMSGVEFEPGMFSAMAVINDQGEFVAGVVFSEFRDHDVQISCAGETSMAWRPHVCRAVFDYVFNQLGCARCTSVTKKSNWRTRRFLTALGFQLEGNLRLGYDGVKDALIYGLLASECRYLREPDSGEENTEGTSGTRSLRNGAGTGGHERPDRDSEREPQPDQSVHTGGEPRVPSDWY